MNTIGFEVINPTFIEFEGMYYLEYNGEFFKGCKRCAGYGHYAHNGEHSRCYDCDNTAAKLGEHLGSDRKVAEKWCHVRALAKANRERKAEEARLKLCAARDERVAALTLSDPEVVALLQKTYDDENEAYNTGDYDVIQKTNPFLRTMAGKLFNAGEKGLTENMVAAVRKCVVRVAEKAAADAAKPALVEGRRVITGKVISTKAVEGDYGTSYKMLVEEADGQRVYGSIASGLWDEVEFLGAYRKLAWNETDGVMRKLVGMEVTFTATVEVSRDDKSFGFFKRPAKASIVA